MSSDALLEKYLPSSYSQNVLPTPKALKSIHSTDAHMYLKKNSKHL